MQTNGLKCRFQPTVAVIGAGISGLTCARTLADHDVPVTVFEKSRGVGGRMATRRNENGAAFDHGAQYFTVRDERFQSCVDSWQHADLVQPWTGRIVSLHDQRAERDKTSTPRFVACPGMNAICKHLAENLEVRMNTRVVPPTRCQRKWLVSDVAGNELGQYDLLIVSAPGPQAGELLQGSPPPGPPGVVRQDRRLLGVAGPVSRSDRCRLRRRLRSGFGAFVDRQKQQQARPQSGHGNLDFACLRGLDSVPSRRVTRGDPGAAFGCLLGCDWRGGGAARLPRHPPLAPCAAHGTAT